ncbi:MAG: 3'-5' exoribonuclease [Candidatus Peribacteraceae bacterium]|nr:3'-5' exoribonuclease [Candidatus Peribacteraceae bacterium]
MNNLMLDIETFSAKPNACLVSIGACQFDIETGKIGSKFYCNIDPWSAITYGGDVDAGTLKWWRSQSEEARDALKGDQETLKVGLSMFAGFYNGLPKNTYVYGNGCGFDNVILSSAYDSVGMRRPWRYNLDADVRTIVKLGGDLLGIKVSDYKRAGTHHNALDDALFQAKMVSDIYQRIKA